MRWTKRLARSLDQELAALELSKLYEERRVFSESPGSAAHSPYLAVAARLAAAGGKAVVDAITADIKCTLRRLHCPGDAQ